jgi:aromatic ring-cleaving dioxygenase
MFEVLFTVENVGGWVNYLSFQNNGSSLLVLPHSNHIKIYDIA